MQVIIKSNIADYLIIESEPLSTALKKIEANEHGIIMCIADNGLFRGTLTDGDIRRWIIRSGGADIDTSVSTSQIINTSSVTATYGCSVQELHKQLSTGLRLIPLLDNNNICKGAAFLREPVLEINGTKIGSGYHCYVIAEIGNNHQGNFEHAKNLITAAFDSGANCAKFQLRDLDTLYSIDSKGAKPEHDLGTQYTLDLLTRYQLPKDDLFRAFDYCYELGIQPLCTPWDENSFQALERYGMPAYKTSSADFTNHDLLRSIAATGKPMICSTGMSTDKDIREAVDVLFSCGAQFALLQCNSTYPAPFKDINLRYMHKLETIGSCPIGYSSHERGINIVTAAVALGASVIEKHFTLDRSQEGNDHRVSLLPKEFKEMTDAIEQVSIALGSSSGRSLSQGELMNRETLGKCIYAATAIEPGEIIRSEMLTVRSPGRGLPPSRKKDLIGTPAVRKIIEGEPLYPSDLTQTSFLPRHYSFKHPFGIPIRYHDLKTIGNKSNFDLLEFHLSYRDLALIPSHYISFIYNKALIVHSPELFEGDHVLDLATPNESYRRSSIEHLQRVVDHTLELSQYFSAETLPAIIVNAGGYTQDQPLDPTLKSEYYERILDSLKQLKSNGVEILPQSMPPFPWHFGGQRYQNLFMWPNEIFDFCNSNQMRACIDISHSRLACNHFKWSFEEFIGKVAPVTRHLHIADASGTDGEGLQIGEGDIDFRQLARLTTELMPNASFIAEVWQGHTNQGEGFWRALEMLEKYF